MSKATGEEKRSHMREGCPLHPTGAEDLAAERARGEAGREQRTWLQRGRGGRLDEGRWVVEQGVAELVLRTSGNVRNGWRSVFEENSFSSCLQTERKQERDWHR